MPAEPLRPPTPAEVDLVAGLLGRPPTTLFEIVVRDRAGRPVVIRNAPLTSEGEPMPTRYWLVGAAERAAVGRLESAGGVRRAERAVDPKELADAHARYAAERDAALPTGYDGPRPAGGVGGTRAGVKCLHAHLAHYLAGGRDPVGRWVVGELAGELAGAVAAIDCGSNSTRLLVLGVDGRPLERRMTITRLGAGLGRSGALDPDAIARVAAACREFRALAEGHGVVRTAAVATAAAREALNADAFVDAVAAALGVAPEIVDPGREAALAYAGAGAQTPDAGGWRVLDVGGGSTELIVGAPDGVAVRSVPLGCVRVTEQFLAHDPPLPAELAAARAHARALLARALADAPELRAPLPLVALAGTAAALAAISRGVDAAAYEALHGTRLGRAEVARLVAALAAEPLAQRARRVGLEPARAPVIVGGAVVLEEAMDALGASEWVHSTHDLLDGLALELLGALV